MVTGFRGHDCFVEKRAVSAPTGRGYSNPHGVPVVVAALTGARRCLLWWGWTFLSAQVGAEAHRVKSVRRPFARVVEYYATGLRWGEGYVERLEKALRRVLRRQEPGRMPGQTG